MKRKELELIDEYLEGTLSDEATLLFEQRLNIDGKFRAEFNQIKLIIEGICSLAFVDDLSRTKQINRFMEQGGILLRQNIDGMGENVIEDLAIDRDWRVVLICESKVNCERLIRQLVQKYPYKFQTIETYNGHFRQRAIRLLKEPEVPVSLAVKKANVNFHY